MSSSSKSVEEMRLLKDMGDGILNRLYFAKGKLLSSEKSKFLGDSEYLLIRTKIEKKFPLAVEYPKYQGGDLFLSKAAEVVDDFQSFYDLMMDIVDFVNASKDLLKSYPLKMMELKLRRSRSLMVLYLDLLVSFMRVLMMTETIEERGVIVSLFVAANNHLSPSSISTSVGHTSRIKTVLDDCANLPRYFIDTFATCASFIRPMIVDLKDSLAQANDTDGLRHHCSLNPINQGDQMGSFARRPLSTACPLSMYSEVAAAVTLYGDYVMFSVLACPCLLFEEPVLEVLRAATSHRCLATLHRDLTVNVHMELERLSTFYPHHTADPGVAVPKGMKFKSVLKHISRDSVGGAALAQRKRRGLVAAELAALNNMIRMTPGLVAPKFPMLLTACALAKSELIAYFQHVEPFTVRKDSKANYSPAAFVTDDLSSLLVELQASVALIRQHRSLVTDYFTEYLLENDLRLLGRLCGDCSAGIANMTSYFDSFTEDLRRVRDAQAAGSGPSSLEALRLNWERCLAVTSAQTMHSVVKASAAAFEKLTDRMHAVVERSLCVDGLDRLLKTYCEPFEVQWFRGPFLASFGATFKDPTYARHLFAYFRVFQNVDFNIHADCPEERPRLGDKSVLLCNSMLADVMAFVVTLVKFLWDNVAALEAQCHPIEAARRLERNLQAKSQGGLSQEAYPGCESEVWAKRQIEKFVLIRRHLTLIMAACRGAEVFRVFGRTSYNPVEYIHQSIVAYFSTRLHGLFLSAQAADKPVSRFSIALSKLSAGCRSIQFALNFIDFPVDSLLKDILFKELQDSTIAPPGGVTAPGATLGASTSLIHKLGGWFLSLGEFIVAVNGSSSGGVVWVPHQNLFVSNVHRRFDTDLNQGGSDTNRRGSVGANVGNFGSQAVEQFLAREELRELAGFIGIQGVRTIEHMLLTKIVEHIRIIVKFLVDYRASLTSFDQSYYLSLTSANGMMTGLDVLFEAMKNVGVFLLLRKMLFSALESVSVERFEDLHGAVSSVAGTLNPWADLELAQSVSLLAASLGMTDDLDLSFVAAVAQMGLKQEELQVLSLFPLAAASLFVSDRWLKGAYIPQIEAFGDNEHCVPFAAAKLTAAFFALQTLNNVQPAKPASSSEEDGRYSVPRVSKVSAEQARFRAYVDKYFSVSSMILLTLRSTETDRSAHFPFRAMCLMLDLFLAHCPVVDHGHLESKFPHALNTSGLLEMTLGKHSFTDTLDSFTHPAVVAE